MQSLDTLNAGTGRANLPGRIRAKMIEERTGMLKALRWNILLNRVVLIIP